MAARGSTLSRLGLVVVIVLIVLGTTGVWNPWPQLWTWFNTSAPIAAGASQWQVTVGGSPQSVAIVGDAVVVSYRTSIEAYGLGAGAKLWGSDADWAAPAGDGLNAVLVTGRLLTKGYQVVDPRTGVVKRADTRASAVWTYQDAILDLHCGKSDDCELTAWSPNGTAPLWTVNTGGIGFVLDAANPDLPDTRQLTASAGIDDQVGGRGPMPSLLGLPQDGEVRVINTATGQVVRTEKPGDDQRVSVAGGRILTITGTAADGTCYYGVVAAATSGQTVWKRDGLNLRTAENGSDCKQDRDPAGGQDVVLGVDPVGRQELIAAHDGRVLWHGDKGENVLAVDDSYALIRSADQKTLRGWSFTKGAIVWRRDLGNAGAAALTPYASIIVSTKPARVIALDSATGAVRKDVRTDAKIFTAGQNGLIAVSGRDMAYLPFS